MVKHLNATPDGATPQSDLLLAKDGSLYGTCYGGGQFGNGTIFKISTAKKLQNLISEISKVKEKICSFIDTAIQILRKHLPEQLLLFSETKFKRNLAFL